MNKSVDRRNNLRKSGASAESQTAYKPGKYDEISMFLVESVSNKSTESNVTLRTDSTSQASCSSSSTTNNILASPDLSDQNRLTRYQESPVKTDAGNKSAKGKAAAANEFVQSMASSLNDQLISQLGPVQEPPPEKEDDESLAFCKGLVAQLRDLPNKKRRLAKIKIQQMLYDMEFGDES